MYDRASRLIRRWASNRACRQSLFRLVAVLLLTVSVAACGSPEAKEKQYLAKGIELYQSGSDEKAMLELRNALRLNPKNAEALYYVGLIHERAKRWPQAFAAYQAAVAEKPDLVPAQIKLGTLALMANEIDTAERAASAAEKLEPKNADALAIQAAVMLRRQDLQRAMDTAAEALAIDPKNENALAVTVGVLDARGRTDEALAKLDQSIAAAPKSASLLLLKMALLDKAGRKNEVAATFEKLIEIEPTNRDYWLGLVNYYQASAKDNKAAETTLRRMLDKGLVDTQTISTLVGLLYATQGLPPAETELKTWIAKRPDDYALSFLLAELYARAGKPADAEKVLAGIVAKGEPKNAVSDAKSATAELKLAAGDTADATAIADEVLKDDPDHRGANLIRGVIFLQAGDTDAALRNARAALRANPDWPPALRLLAQIHQAKGELDLAIQTLRQVLEKEPGDTASAERIAVLLSRQGDFDGALRAWSDIVNSGNASPQAVQARASIAIQQGDWSMAQGDINKLLQDPKSETTGAFLAGQLSLAQQHFAQGRDWFAKVEAAQPNAQEPVIGTVRAFLAENNLQGALDYLNQRKTRQPEDAMAYALTGELLARENKLPEAQQALVEAVKLQPKWVDARRQLAGLQAKGGDVDAAIATVDAALRETPGNETLLMDRAGIQLNAGRLADAAKTFEQVMAVNKGNDVAANNYAAIIADFGYTDPADLKKAVDVAQRFRSSDNAFYLDTLGWLLYRQGDFLAAATYLERATTTSPDEKQFRYHLGMALYKAGQKERAFQELQKAVGEGVDYTGIAEARDTLAKLQTELGQPASMKSSG